MDLYRPSLRQPHGMRAPGDQVSRRSDDGAEDRGYRVLPARRAVLHPCPREGGALSNSLQKKKALSCFACKVD